MKILVVIFEENISKKYKISKKIQEKKQVENRWKGNRSKLKKKEKKKEKVPHEKKKHVIIYIYSEIVMVKKIIYVW